MKRIVFIILCFNTILLQGQDPSFSQFDLNMIYSNPGFSGYEGGTKSLLHSRNQWNSLNDNFNTSIFELSSNIKLNPNNRKTRTSWGPGIGLTTEDLGILLSGNSVFIKKTELMLYPMTFHMKLAEVWYLSGGAGINFRKYSLESNSLIFSDQWGEYGVFNPITNAPINTFIHDGTKIDGSFGFIITKHGKYQSNRGNRFMLGSSLNHITKPSESFSGNENKESMIPLKHIIHAEWFYGIPAYKRTFIPYVKTIFKHERYIDEYYDVFKPWGESKISKTEFGTTAILSNTNIELGLLYRLVHNYNNYHIQTIIPIFRFLKSFEKLKIGLSYSYDMNIAGSNRLNIGNTGSTHEMGLIIYLFSSKGKGKSIGNTDCPAFMKNGALFEDIYNNGLNKRK
jgi:type IX secretion system PorP/SprF family membrane protein